MGYKIAIDFGTTNSVVALWNDETETAEIVACAGLSAAPVETRPVIIPSLLYIHNGQSAEVSLGEQVVTRQLDSQQDNRLFRNFKRGIVSSPAPEPREIDGVAWDDKAAGRVFNRQLIHQLPYALDDVEQLVLTVPVASFEGYLAWLNEVTADFPQDKIRIVDESTAAALGYAVTNPGAPVLVFDFGGGTLDLSLVQLPESKDKTGGFLKRLIKSDARKNTARVIAKAGRIIGGSDIDQWLLAEVLQRTGLTPTSLGSAYPAALTACEKAKIHLSEFNSATINFTVDTQQHEVVITRAELESLLENNGFYTALRRVVDKVMYVARQRGIYKEDIAYVLMVGGTSLMPSVQSTLATYFTKMAVRADKPFTAVAEGALQVAAGYGLDDYLVHGYGLRFLTEEGKHDYDEIIPMGSAYPTTEPVEVLLGAAHPNQTEMEFVIGEIDTEAVSMIEVKYEDGQAVFVAKANEHEQRITPINATDVLKYLAKLDPPATPGVDRLKAEFGVDERRQLRLTVTDLATGNLLLDRVAVATLR